jgi:hypothetical protein
MRHHKTTPNISKIVIAATVAVLLLALTSCHHERSIAGTPRREDHGDLIVLHLYGSYYDMGRQQVELLGPVARRMYAYHHDKYVQALQHGGVQLHLLDWGTRLLPVFGPWYEESGFFDELNGIADALGVPRSDVVRATTASSFGSTVFAATRSATADGGAIIGRNVDWEDADGTLRPVVMHFHPDNGDFDYIMAGWPLIGAPAIGINATGFALSFNFFITDEFIGIPPQMRDRRALQTARTVEEGLRVFTNVRKRGMPTFMVMADAGGDIAMIECTPSEYAIFRPDGDWFAQANSARTDKMIPFDRYRAPESFRRRAAMEAAVQKHLGAITPTVAADIVRDRSSSRFVNDATVANLYVLNAAVIQPATKTLWHATSMQPEAPFGTMLPFSVGADVSATAPLPADARFGTAAMDTEQSVVRDARRAVRLYAAGDRAGAGAVWDGLVTTGDGILHPDRLAYARAIVRLEANRLHEADALFATLDSNRAPFEVRAAGLVGRAVIADQEGHRSDALTFYKTAGEYLNGYPQYTDAHTQQLRAVVTAGLATPQRLEALPDPPDLQYVPR